jgi:hypothetical protein
VANQAEPTITLTDAPDDDERAVITDGLRAYNEAQAGCRDGRSLAILAGDPETKKVVGGLLGRISLGLLTVERFFLPEDLRTDLVAGSSVWQRKNRSDAAVSTGCCPHSTFMRRVSI